jgi:hypothetical protein
VELAEDPDIVGAVGHCRKASTALGDVFGSNRSDYPIAGCHAPWDSRFIVGRRMVVIATR